MRWHFTKYQGLGNDYLFLDLFRQEPPCEQHIPEIARTMSHRRLGVGSDGIVLVGPCEDADASMRIFNADGSEAENCGNALRCTAKLLWDQGRLKSGEGRIRTVSGIVPVRIMQRDSEEYLVEVEIRNIRWERKHIPMRGTGTAAKVSIRIPGKTYDATCLSVGNPHCVIFQFSVHEEEVRVSGPLVEHHDLFPDRVNAGFCRVVNENLIRLIVWERGSGMTGACGTGATAAFAAARSRNQVGCDVGVEMPGGRLRFFPPGPR